MKICIAQIAPIKGNISANIKIHKRCIELAASFKAEAIFFPELSLTGYEPELAKELATHQNDTRLAVFQQLSDLYNIIIGLGLPTLGESQIRISMIIFAPNQPRQTYSKQQLHSDELPYFEKGNGQLIIQANETHIAPAICYESLQSNHVEKAYQMGANVYLASVAKPAKGVEKAYDFYPTIAKKKAMPVLMTNCIGFCENFLSVGKSAVWSKEGKLLGQLDENEEGILIFDTETEAIVKQLLMNY
jgi:predicted amidohydrolase